MVKKAKAAKIKAKIKIKAKSKAKKKIAPKVRRARIVKKIVKRAKPRAKPTRRAGEASPKGRAKPPRERIEVMAKAQEQVEAAKYYPPAEHTHFKTPSKKELPQGYGDNRIVLMVRDPYWAYTYWEITDNKKGEIAGKLGVGWDRLAKVLRVYDVTNVIFNGTNANSYFDIEVGDYAATWYVNVGRPDTSWCVDIGVRTPSGEFIMIARSNCITTPRDTASWVTDEEWMIVEEDFRKLYALSGGLRVGLSSAGLKEAMKERLRFELASGSVSSISSPSRKQKKE